MRERGFEPPWTGYPFDSLSERGIHSLVQPRPLHDSLRKVARTWLPRLEGHRALPCMRQGFTRLLLCWQCFDHDQVTCVESSDDLKVDSHVVN